VNELRRRGIASHITAGGWFATVAHKELLSEVAGLDSVVRGEGEYTLVDLLYRLNTGPASVKGLTWKDRETGKITVNENRPRINNLDALKFPARDDLPIIFKTFPRDEYFVHMMTSRGCYASCSFCSVNSLYDSTRSTQRSPANIADEVEALVTKYGVRNFQFIDEIFLNRSAKCTQWALELCDEIERRDLKIKFFIYCRSTDITEEVFRRLKSVGLVMVFVGVEAGTQEALNRYNKATTVEDNTRAIELLRILGIKAQVGFIMIDPAAGFHEIKANYEWLVQSKCFVQNSFTNKLNLYFGTPILHQYIAKEIAVPSGLSERHSYVYQDEKVETYARCVEDLLKISFPLEEKLYGMKLDLRGRKTRLDKVPQDGEIQRYSEFLAQVHLNIQDIWKECIGELIDIIDSGSRDELWSLSSRFRRQCHNLLQVCGHFVDGQQLEAVRLLPEPRYYSDAHYINESLP
jgi:anaerobic magnesium-protoporphyrin IX monomethyl ester cyclase